MERDIRTIHAIKTLGYSGSACVKHCRCEELPCPLLTWLVSELMTTCPELQDRLAGVVLGGELRSLLTDLLCPLTGLAEDTMNPPLLNKIIEFLVSELHAAHIVKCKGTHPEDTDHSGGDESQQEQRLEDYDFEETMKWCQQFEDNEAADDGIRRKETETELALLFQTLDMAPTSHLTDACHKVESRLALLPVGVDVMEPLLDVSLTSEQWRRVEKINQALLEDYECRRQMMIKRFQVTLQSFAWGEKEKERSRALASVPPLSSLSLSSQVSSSLLLAARKDQSCILPVKAGLSTSVYKVLMGSVPDRGGRPREIEPPMPSWEGRRDGGRGRGGGRGGGGRGGGGQRRNFSGKKRNKKNE